MKLHLCLVLFVLFNPASAIADEAQQTPSPTPTPLTVTEVWVDGGRIPAATPTPTPTPAPNASPTPEESPTPKPWASPDHISTYAGLRDRIWVEVAGLTDKDDPRAYVLYLNGQELKETKPVAIKGPNRNWLGFDLMRTADNDPVWRSLLGSPTDSSRKVEVSVGLPGKGPLPTTVGKPWSPTMYLRLYYPRWVWAAVGLLILLVVLFVIRARRGGFIHDSDPPDPEDGKMKPYSLALTQAAWWFFVVLGSFGFIYLITGDYNTVSNQAMILMGLGTGTALGAFMINANKRESVDAQLSTLLPQEARLTAEAGQTADPVALAEKRAKLVELRHQIDEAKSGMSRPVSAGFWKDILTDVNGIALHRFQIVAWTLALGVTFIIGVYRNLSMPEFSPALLALMGISAVTYLGFKFPERQTDPANQTPGR
jgi:hypothetical protein